MIEDADEEDEHALFLALVEEIDLNLQILELIVPHLYESALVEEGPDEDVRALIIILQVC